MLILTDIHAYFSHSCIFTAVFGYYLDNLFHPVSCSTGIGSFIALYPVRESCWWLLVTIHLFVLALFLLVFMPTQCSLSGHAGLSFTIFTSFMWLPFPAVFTEVNNTRCTVSQDTRPLLCMAATFICNNVETRQ